MSAAKAARAEIRGYRSALEKTRAAIKAPVWRHGQWIDTEAQRINAELLAIEEPIDAAIKAEEQRKVEEKAAQTHAEAARVVALAARVNAIHQRVIAVANQEAAVLREALAQAQAFEPDPDEFAERWPDVMKAIGETRRALETLCAEREARDARQAEENARLQTQREALARQQAELDQQRVADEAQRQAEREELARLRTAENARRQQETEAQARAEAEARQQAEREAQARAEEDAVRAKLETLALAENPIHHKARRIIKDPLAAIKDALAAGTLNGADAIDRAYQLGFKAGENAARKAA